MGELLPDKPSAKSSSFSHDHHPPPFDFHYSLQLVEYFLDDPKKSQTPAAMQQYRVESLVAVQQQTHRETTPLHEEFPDSSILAFNFCKGEKQSQFAGILCEDEVTIMDYPRQYEGYPFLPLSLIQHLLCFCESWLSHGNQQNIILLHCETGGWPHRMKSVSMAKLTSQEIEALQNDRNQRARELFDKKPGKAIADGDSINSEYLKWGNEAKELGGTLSEQLQLEKQYHGL